MSTSQTFPSLPVPQPASPGNWSTKYIDDILARCNRRIEALPDRTGEMPQGRAAPALEQVAIGSGKHYALSVLFLDICGFSLWPSSNHAEQATVLRILNVFMAEMMNIVRDYGGTFEKNTGDGLMAYFGANQSDLGQAVLQSVHCALTMCYVNDVLMAPWLQRNNWPRISFRIGIDCGAVTIGRVGVPGGLNSFVAIGATANIACKIMRLMPDGGVCVGELVCRHLPVPWHPYLCRLAGLTGFVFVANQQPYPAYGLTYRLPYPR